MKIYEKIYSFGALFFSFIIATLIFNIVYQLIQIKRISNKKYSLKKKLKI